MLQANQSSLHASPSARRRFAGGSGAPPPGPDTLPGPLVTRYRATAPEMGQRQCRRRDGRRREPVRPVSGGRRKSVWLRGFFTMLAAPLAAEGQPGKPVPKIGLLRTPPPGDAMYRALLGGRQAHGYAEGKDVLLSTDGETPSVSGVRPGTRGPAR
jgi:hypothetical protein